MALIDRLHRPGPRRRLKRDDLRMNALGGTPQEGLKAVLNGKIDRKAWPLAPTPAERVDDPIKVLKTPSRANGKIALMDVFRKPLLPRKLIGILVLCMPAAFRNGHRPASFG